MDDEYLEALHKFQDIYEYMKKKYHLQMHLSFPLWDESHITVFEWVNDNKTQLMRVSAETSTQCLNVAAERLKGILERREDAEGLSRDEIAS